MTQGDGPDLGHTFRFCIAMRGSSKVVGEPHHHDHDEWHGFKVVDIRAWSLREALSKAYALPMSAWFEEEPDEG